MSVYMHVYMGTCRGQERSSDSLELGLQVAMSPDRGAGLPNSCPLKEWQVLVSRRAPFPPNLS